MHIDNVIFLILSKNAYTKFSAGPRKELLIDSCLDRLRHREALRQVDNSLGDDFFYILTRQLSFDLLCHKG